MDKWIKRGKNELYPTIVNSETAQKAIQHGVGAASLIVIISGVMGIFSGKAFYESSMIDGIIFAFIAFGIFKKSRIVAVYGFILFLVEITDKLMSQLYQGKKISIGIASLLLLFFINSIRGTFAYH